MNMPQIGKALAVAAVATFAASNAFAATQGTLGATSTGSLNITLTIDALVQISALDDIPLGNYTGGANMTGADDLCVYSNTGGYEITATGDDGAGGGVRAGRDQRQHPIYGRMGGHGRSRNGHRGDHGHAPYRPGRHLYHA